MDESCPVAKIVRVLSMKWNMLILRELTGKEGNLGNGKMRFNSLLEELKPVSSRTLSKRLKELEQVGLVRREQFNEVPPRVEYSLTPSGTEIIKCFKVLSDWAEKFGNA